MKNRIDHVGYLTGDILSTAKAFEKLGYQMGEIVDDDTQRTRICFLTKPGRLDSIVQTCGSSGIWESKDMLFLEFGDRFYRISKQTIDRNYGKTRDF